MSDHDVAIIGGGPGGYVCAIRAAKRGLKVVLIEDSGVGGTCLNRGCIPTKTLIAGTELYRRILNSGDFGIITEGCRPYFDRMMERKSKVVERLQSGVKFLLKRAGVELVEGRGRLVKPTNVEVLVKGGDTLSFSVRKVVIATGSRPILPRAFGYDGVQVISSDEALECANLPESILIAGAGVVGCEFAGIYSALGCRVTVLDSLPTILATVDSEIATVVGKALARRGVLIKTGTKVESVSPDQGPNGTVRVCTDGGEVFHADRVLVSVGRMPSMPGINPAAVGLQVGPRGELVVDEHMQTSVDGIYAIGDVTARAMLAHVASAQGIVAAETIAGREAAMDYTAVPSCVFTDPEVATVGLTEAEANAAGLPTKVGRFPLSASGKALAMGEPEGFVKIVADAETGRVLGVHIVGAHASDLIGEGVLAVRYRLTTEQLAGAIHAHPTLAEGIMEAAEAADGIAIHF